MGKPVAEVDPFQGNFNEPNEDDLFLPNEDDDTSAEPDLQAQVEDLKKQVELERKKANAIFQEKQDLLLKVKQPQQTQKPMPAVNEPDFTIPPKPYSYDEQSAYGDPSSESFKWRTEKEKIEYAQMAYEQERRIIGQVGQMLDLQMRSNKIQSMEDQFKQASKISDEEFNKFKNFLTEERSLGMDELYEVYKKRQGIVDQGTEIKNTRKATLPSYLDFTGPSNEPENIDIEFEKGLNTSARSMMEKY